MNRIVNNMHTKYKKVAFIKASSLWLLIVALKINSFMIIKKRVSCFVLGTVARMSSFLTANFEYVQVEY